MVGTEAAVTGGATLAAGGTEAADLAALAIAGVLGRTAVDASDRIEAGMSGRTEAGMSGRTAVDA